MTSFFYCLISMVYANTNDILEQIKASQRWTNQTQQLHMVIDGKRGHKEYDLVTHLKKTPDALYAHAQFLAPKVVQNTQVIIVNHSQQDDEMWLFLPALNRVTVLKDDNRQRAFMGSDFAFDDFMLWDIPQTHSVESETTTHLTVNVQPTKPTQIQYTKWQVKVDKSTSQPLEVVFYDQDKATKKMTLTAYQEGFPRQLNMTNLQTGSTTTIQVQSIDTQTDIPLSQFQKDTLIPKAQP